MGDVECLWWLASEVSEVLLGVNNGEIYVIYILG